MKAVIYDAHTTLWPNTEEVKRLCKIGEGAETCILLLVGPDGFECHAKNKMLIWSLIERARRGETNAQREGCEEVDNWSPLGMEFGEVDITDMLIGKAESK